ncbi:MAG: response regulator [Proteobacteria bacterium]|nr:response regulator [Pseudomonadota bacterium]
MINLLVIDENKSDRTLIKRLLRHTNLEIEVIEADNLEEGQKHIQDKDVNCILLYIGLTDAGGRLSVLEKLTADKAVKCPVVVLTGIGDEELSRKSLQAGAQDFLVKDDLTHVQLSRAIVNALERQDLLDQRLKMEKESMQFGRIIEESLNEIYFINPETFKVISLNRGARENLGYSPEELQDLTITTITPEYGVKDYARLVEPLVKGKIEKISFESKHLRKNGTTYYVGGSLQYSNILEAPVLVAIVEDITEKKITSERLKQAQKMEAVGNLSGGVAHDFNNLLTAVRGSLHLLEMSVPANDKVAMECLDIAVMATRRGADLTRRLLAFSRKQSLKPENVEINDVIRNVTPLLRRTIEETINIESYPLKKKVFVNIDVPEFENALVNLAINARDAMPDGGHLLIEVNEKNVGTEQAEIWSVPPGRYAVISVSDSGCGIPPEIMDKIFEPFFTTKEVGQGTGLGLSMVYGFVKQSGGHLSIYSEPGQGTTFRIYLGITTGDKKTKIKKEIKADRIIAGEGIILLVEDDEPVSNFVAAALKVRGYEVLVAPDGPSAIKIINRTKSIDLLFSDVILPKGMLGPEIGEKFAIKFPKSGILYSSGYTGKSLEKKGFRLEKKDLLIKPYDLSEMFERIQDKLPTAKS